MTSNPNMGIYFVPDGYITDSKTRIMGRQAAGEGFLRAWFQHSHVREFICHCEKRENGVSFAQFGDSVLNYLQKKPTYRWFPTNNPGKLASIGALYYPDPNIAALSWIRRRANLPQGDAAYSLIGITHTVATEAAATLCFAALNAPTQPWDAIICTSNSVKNAVTFMWEQQSEYLRERFGNITIPQPQLPVIPLGVHANNFRPSPAIRSVWRERLNLAPDEIAVLFFGRLSVHSKANPLPMYIALEQAAQLTHKKLVLIQAGWFQNDEIKQTFIETAQQFAPSVRCIFEDGTDTDIRQNIWFAADIFCSLVDNIQETFGLTPIEAMAAGLPCIISDFNGYKETVRDGIDGYRIPTTMVAPGNGAGIQEAFATKAIKYPNYIGLVTMGISVDIRATTAAFVELINNPEKRASMGEAGRERANSVFDWRVIIEQYQGLIRELTHIRSTHQPQTSTKTRKADPIYHDPYTAYTHYPSAIINNSDRYTLTTGASLDKIATLLTTQLIAPQLKPSLLPAIAPDNLNQVMSTLIQLGVANTTMIAELCQNLSVHDIQFCLVWLSKVGLVEPLKS